MCIQAASDSFLIQSNSIKLHLMANNLDSIIDIIDVGAGSMNLLPTSFFC